MFFAGIAAKAAAGRTLATAFLPPLSRRGGWEQIAVFDVRLSIDTTGNLPPGEGLKDVANKSICPAIKRQSDATTGVVASDWMVRWRFVFVSV